MHAEICLTPVRESTMSKKKKKKKNSIAVWGCVREEQMKRGNASLSTPEPNETRFVYLNTSRSPAVNQEAAGAALQRQALHC